MSTAVVETDIPPDRRPAGGGLVELVLGRDAEQEPLEDVAEPVSAIEAWRRQPAEAQKCCRNGGSLYL